MARERRISDAQFLVEAGAVGLIGGVAGILLGALATVVAEQRYGQTDMVSGDLVIDVVAVAIGTGLLFGYIPAQRASRLDPLEAMQAEG